MIQQEMLQYQALDGELNRIERDLRKNENFIKRKQYKALSQECEENLGKLDAKAQELRNQLAQARQTVDKINEVIEEHAKEIGALEDVDELNYMNKKLNEQLTELSNIDKDIKRILKEGEEISKSFDDINTKLPKLVKLYNKCNEDFNQAAAEVKPRVRELQLKQAELKKVIDPELFDRYKRVSEGGLHPVFVPLQDGTRCGGCRMDMPKAVVDTQMASKPYMRCEHCGRIIYKEN
ncbi:MAG: hypothetical protein J1F65_02185 [Clostridiales bacterium]|nr:hypothetical protein [Clostridiales bacterium]